MSAIRAIFFDQDGVIIDTERDGHRVAFNRAFAQCGLAVEWSVDAYHEYLQVGGGKERMTYYFDTYGYPKGVGAGERGALIQRLHEIKTSIFVEMINSRQLPLRPGVHRLMRQARDAGMSIGICTTSNEKVASAIVTGYLADINFNPVLAGDIVKRKKPDPEIYRLAIERAAVKPHEAIVVEDSEIGIAAAKAAGLRVVATASAYTLEEDLSAADLVVTSLGELPDAPARVIHKHRPIPIAGEIHLSHLLQYFA